MNVINMMAKSSHRLCYNGMIDVDGRIKYRDHDVDDHDQHYCNLPNRYEVVVL